MGVTCMCVTIVCVYVGVVCECKFMVRVLYVCHGCVWEVEHVSVSSW